jgi:pilus assembly protein FimV
VTPPKASEFKFSDINLNLSDQPVTGAKAGTDHWHEVSTKLDLARVYHEMGDAAGAKDILAEVLQEGDAAQRAAAQEILTQLS